MGGFNSKPTEEQEKATYGKHTISSETFTKPRSSWYAKIDDNPQPSTVTTVGGKKTKKVKKTVKPKPISKKVTSKTSKKTTK